MKGVGRKLFGALKRMTRSSSSHLRGKSSSCHSPEPTSTPTTVYDEQDEQEEQIEEQAEESQAEDIEIDEDDTPYLDLHDNRERQAYAMIKHRSFGHTRAFDLDLLEKTGMDVDFAHVWHVVDGMVLCPLRRMVLVSSPSSFFALFERWTMVFFFDFLELNAILIN